MDADTKKINPALRRALLRNPKSPRGTASDYLRALATLAPQPVVLYCRESSGKQNCTGNLEAQIAFDRQLLEERGFTVVADFAEVASGQRDGSKLNRPVLLDAIRYARKHGLPLVAESTDRLIRAWDFTKYNQGAVPTVNEFELLMAAAGDVPLFTILDPDADWKTVRAFQTQRGRIAKDRKGGRPVGRKPGGMLRRRKLLLIDVRFQHRLGLPLAEIMENTGLPKTTIRDWVRLYC